MRPSFNYNYFSCRDAVFEPGKGDTFTYRVGNGPKKTYPISDLSKQVKSLSHGIIGNMSTTAIDEGQRGKVTNTPPVYQYHLAVGLKHLYAEHNIYVLNTIQSAKNQKTSNSLWFKVANFITKICTFGKVNLKEKLRTYHKIPLSFSDPDPDAKRIDALGTYFIQHLTDALKPEQLKTIQFTAKVPPKESFFERMHSACRQFITNGGKLEDYFIIPNEIDGQKGWSLDSLYHMAPQGMLTQDDHITLWAQGEKLRE